MNLCNGFCIFYHKMILQDRIYGSSCDALLLSAANFKRNSLRKFTQESLLKILLITRESTGNFNMARDLHIVLYYRCHRKDCVPGVHFENWL